MTYIHRKIDLETGKEIDVPYTKDELNEVAANEIKQAEKIIAINEANAAKQAVLDKLNLTADEVAALLG